MNERLREFYQTHAPAGLQSRVDTFNHRVVQPIKDAMQPALEVTAVAMNPAMRLLSNFLDERVSNTQTSKFDRIVGGGVGLAAGFGIGSFLDQLGISNSIVNTLLPVAGGGVLGYNATRLAVNAARRIHEWSDANIMDKSLGETAEYTAGQAVKHAGEIIYKGLKDGAHEVSVRAEVTGQRIGHELKNATHSASSRILEFLDKRGELSWRTRKRLAVAGGIIFGTVSLVGASATILYGVPDTDWYIKLGALGWLGGGVATAQGTAYIDRVAKYTARQIHDWTAPESST